MLGVALGVGIAVVACLWRFSASPEERAVVATTPASVLVPLTPAEAEGASSVTASVPSIDVLDLPGSAGHTPSARARNTDVPAKPKPTVDRPRSSLDELAAVEQVRKELTNGDVAAARRDIAHYRETFTVPRFTEEIDALEIEALATGGARPAAEAKATQFLKRYPLSPYARRVRSVVGDTQGAP
jgi:hypothetical protein